jgi:hypothetical protein
MHIYLCCDFSTRKIDLKAEHVCGFRGRPSSKEFQNDRWIIGGDVSEQFSFRRGMAALSQVQLQLLALVSELRILRVS